MEDMAGVFWQSVLRFDAAKIAPDIALRNTIGVVIPLIAGAAMGNSSAGVVGALGALNVSYSDSRDPYAVRVRRMLVASVVVGIAVFAGAISARNEVTALLTATLCAFGAGMLVVLGSRAGDLGAITLVTLIVFAARSLTLVEALESGLIGCGGGVLQAALSVAIWPVSPHAPERQIIGALYRSLAQAAVSPAGSTSAPPASGPIASAQDALSVLASDHSHEAERLVFLLDQAERIRLSLLTLRRLARRMERDAHDHAPAQALNDVLNAASGVLNKIGDCAEKGRAPSSLNDFDQAAREFGARNPESASAMFAAVQRDARRQVDALAGQLRAAAGLSSRESPRNRPARAGHDLFDRRAHLLANLSFQSTAFRHAVRLAVCVGLGDAIGRSVGLQRSYWLPMTIAIVLKPDFTGTFSRGILRIAGTLAGLAVATILFHSLPRSAATDIALLSVFSFLLRWIGPANYAIFVTAISGIIVLLIAVTGVDPKDAIIARAVNTTLGGALALLAYRIWPTWERTQTGVMLGALLDTYRVYFHSLMVDANTEELDGLRAAGRVARSNAEASVTRFSAEPGTSKEQRILVNEILVSSHSFARAAMAIESGLDQADAPAGTGAARDFAVSTETTLRALADSFRNSSNLPESLPDLREAWTAVELEARNAGQPYSLLTVETDRVATSLNTLREQVARWNRLK